MAVRERSMARYLLTAAMATSSACVTSPTTVFVGPRCSSVRSSGAAQYAENIVAFNHKNDLPYTSRTVIIELQSGKEERIEVVSDKQEGERLFAGLTLVALGSVGIIAAYITQFNTGNDQYLQYLAGSSSLLTGTYAIATGWRPNQDVMVKNDEECADKNK